METQLEAAPPERRRKPARTRRSQWYSSLFAQVLAAIVLGVGVGWLAPGVGEQLAPLADLFMRLIKMLIGPIVFCTVVLGVAHVGDVAAVGRIGVKALVYFELATTFALVFGLVVGNVVRPGAGFHIDAAALTAGADAIAAKTAGGELPGAVEFILGVVPTSLVAAFAENSLLQILFLAVLFGAAIAKLAERSQPVVALVESASGLCLTVMGWVMRLAPLGAFGAMASIIGQYGVGSLASYGKLIAACYAAAAAFAVVLAVILKLAVGLSLWRVAKYVKDELFLALGTASTEVVLSRVMSKLTAAGCSRATTGLVMPTGYSFNLDGATLYLAVCVLFLAQALGVDLSVGEQITALLILMLTSKGMAGVPGSSFLALSATVAAIGSGAIPVAAVALLLGADRIMDSMRVSINVVGNCVATFVVAAWEGQLDKEQARRVLGSRRVASNVETL
jgi:aerobic C4-dicarboxylate transport protein